MGVHDDVEAQQLTEPERSNKTEDDTDDSSKWYPGEWYIWYFPVARTFTSAFWIYNILWAGIDFILDYVCTTGMRATFWSTLVIATIFAAYSIYAWKPMPMTFTIARQGGLNQFWCMIYSLYQSALAGIAFFVMFMCGLMIYIPVEDFWDWNCGKLFG
mmetsp:Transcript_24332/g.37505  ORF Transcript_24332/g.37505 Transcript_24332/m.37505 type:complete len:158 (-) Transcript_24332:298-771(-)|eukprot:CAMPEP_0196806852 /NCGR_PEP_ID=MMETSP1362-20130617/6783_1 /TAXON_ID=163516 /ORGANISM="Leptocylindrus danicus, Strain CCMP1856" /LENGTH=157 /DNA_ID=CAMNT_0042180521 /DNA_START=114 /DNA_END=587 /DNA_ORIENTATION=-